jgi:hypothetical protein
MICPLPTVKLLQFRPFAFRPFAAIDDLSLQAHRREGFQERFGVELLHVEHPFASPFAGQHHRGTFSQKQYIQNRLTPAPSSRSSRKAAKKIEFVLICVFAALVSEANERENDLSFTHRQNVTVPASRRHR